MVQSGAYLGKDSNFDDGIACEVQHCQHNIQDTASHMRRLAAGHARVPCHAFFPRFVRWKVRRRGGIEPLHVSMPRELKSRPSTSLTHPGISNLEVRVRVHHYLASITCASCGKSANPSTRKGEQPSTTTRSTRFSKDWHYSGILLTMPWDGSA